MRKRDITIGVLAILLLSAGFGLSGKAEGDHVDASCETYTDYYLCPTWEGCIAFCDSEWWGGVSGDAGETCIPPNNESVCVPIMQSQ